VRQVAGLAAQGAALGSAQAACVCYSMRPDDAGTVRISGPVRSRALAVILDWHDGGD
jgi:hypothetical protein